MEKIQLHASCVAFNNQAVLIRGKPGSGKSDLVLRLIDAEGFGLSTTPRRATLVADDQVILTKADGEILASPPKVLQGKLEIRGVGIVELDWVSSIPLCLVVDLLNNEKIPRMPEYIELETEILGQKFPRLMLNNYAPAAAAILRSKCFSLSLKTR
jgi:HPr kinase/phosphorylase